MVPRNEGREGQGREGTSGGSGRGRKETTTLSVIRVSWQQSPSTVAITADQEGGPATGTETLGTTVTEGGVGMALSLQHVSTISLPHPSGYAGRARGASTGSTPSLVLLRGYQSPPRLLVVIDGSITCRPLSDLSCVLFRMDALGGSYNNPIMPSPISPPVSPVMSFSPRVCVQVVVGFGRLLVSVCTGGGGGVSGPNPLDSPTTLTTSSPSAPSAPTASIHHRRPRVHVVPLLYLAAGTGGVETGSTPSPLPLSPIPPQQAHAKGVLIDPCEHRLLLISSRGHKSNSFSPLPLPASIVEQWRAQAFSASLARARTLRPTYPQRGVGGDSRLSFGGHDVSIEPHHTHAGPLVALSAAVGGSGARRGYLAVVMGDQSGTPPPDVPLSSHTTTHHVAPTLPPTDLWLYNLSTHRWRSTDLSISTSLLLLRSSSSAKNHRRLSYSDSNQHPQMTHLTESKRRPSAPPAVQPSASTTPLLSRGNSLATQSAEGWPATLDTPHPLSPSIDDCDVVSVMSDHTLPHPAGPGLGQSSPSGTFHGLNRSSLHPSHLPPRQQPFSASGNITASAGIAGGSGNASGSSPNNLSQPAVLAVAWFGEHTVVLLTRRIVALVGSTSRGGDGDDQGDNDGIKSSPSSPPTHTAAAAAASTPYNYYLEVLSRAPTKQSLRAGRPRPGDTPSHT